MMQKLQIFLSLFSLTHLSSSSDRPAYVRWLPWRSDLPEVNGTSHSSDIKPNGFSTIDCDLQWANAAVCLRGFVSVGNFFKRFYSRAGLNNKTVRWIKPTTTLTNWAIHHPLTLTQRSIGMFAFQAYLKALDGQALACACTAWHLRWAIALTPNTASWTLRQTQWTKVGHRLQHAWTHATCDMWQAAVNDCHS